LIHDIPRIGCRLGSGAIVTNTPQPTRHRGEESMVIPYYSAVLLYS
jgi:hypothetical protein